VERGKAACRAKGDVGLTYRIADEATRAREANERPQIVLFCCVGDERDPNQTDGGTFTGGPGLALNITERVELDARTGRGQSSAAPPPVFLRILRTRRQRNEHAEHHTCARRPDA